MAGLSFTHHSPVGAWSTLAFGEAGRGAVISHESMEAAENADLLIGLSRGSGRTGCLPFMSETLPAGWRAAEASAVTRTLTPCIDSYSSQIEGATLTFRVYTSHVAIPNPKRARSLQYATMPGLLVEVTVDNSDSDEPATAFLGLRWRGEGLIRPLDWSSRSLCGVAVGNRWALGAIPAQGQVFTVCGTAFADAVERGTPALQTDANIGGLALKVEPRGSRSLLFSFTFHHSGLATYGIDARYVFGGYFSRIDAAGAFVLASAARIKESCSTLDTRLTRGQDEDDRLAVFAQAVRQYDACTQLVDAGNGGIAAPHFSVLTGPRAWRNALDAAIDVLPWELLRSPWVVRNVFDLYSSAYAYADQVLFPQDDGGIDLREGGMALCHDMGTGGCYAPATTSAAEQVNGRGRSGYATSESVLNAIYLLTSYALTAEDNPWSKTRLPFARELLRSMEHRDHHDPALRNGILKAESILCGPKGAEATTFGAVDDQLGTAHGSMYLAMKTFCASILLTTYFQNNNDLHSADYAYAMAQKTATTVAETFEETRGLLPLNLYKPTDSAALVILEPLAVPTYLGLTSTLAEYFPSLMEKLKRHAMSCLKSGVCVDLATGGLKLASHTNASMPSKAVAMQFVIERLLQIDLATEAPRATGALLAAITQRGVADARLASAIYLVKPLLADQQAQESPVEDHA